VAEFTENRDRQDHDRYLRIYNIDIDNYQFANLIIDTEEYDPLEIAELIVKKAYDIKTPPISK
jgi:cytidylate kinase